MPSVTGSPFDDEPVLRTAKSSLSRPLPIANRFDVPSIKDLSLSVLPFPRLFARSVPFCPSKNSVSRFPCVEKKSVPRFFCPPFFHPFPTVFPPSILPDFGKSVFSVRDRFFQKRRDKACGLWAKFLRLDTLIFQTYVTNNVDLFPGSNRRHESRVTLVPFSTYHTNTI